MQMLEDTYNPPRETERKSTQVFIQRNTNIAPFYKEYQDRKRKLMGEIDEHKREEAREIADYLEEQRLKYC